MPRARKPSDPTAPPENRGGVRQGQPGRVYQNRSDLNVNRQPAQPIRVASGQEYGQRQAQERAQRAVPLPQTPAPPAVRADGLPDWGPLSAYAGELGPFDRPTDRPGEPVTAGIASGPGPGPEALTPRGGDTLAQLRAIYTAFPDESLREIIEDFEQEQGGPWAG